MRNIIDRIVEADTRGEVHLPPDFWKLDAAARERKAAELLRTAPPSKANGKPPTHSLRTPDLPRVPRPATWQYPGRLAVCVVHMNPCGYRRREETFVRFAEAAISQGAEVFVVSSGPAPLVEGVAGYLDLGPCEILWQKERALNILIDELPDEYDKVAWVDGDLLWDNPHWVEDTCRQLERTPVCQCFAWAVWLNRADVPEYWNTGYNSLYRPSVPLALVRDEHSDFRKGHPGFAWAARRETIREIGGLYDRHILGSGDSIMALGFLRDIEGHPYFDRFSGPFRHGCEAWCRRVSAVIKGNVGFVPGTVRHLWHGSREDRHYDGRLLRIALAGYDPVRHIELDDNGLWRWSRRCPVAIKTFVRDYFYARNEDGIETAGTHDPLGLALFDDPAGHADL